MSIDKDGRYVATEWERIGLLLLMVGVFAFGVIVGWTFCKGRDDSEVVAALSEADASVTEAVRVMDLCRAALGGPALPSQ